MNFNSVSLSGRKMENNEEKIKKKTHSILFFLIKRSHLFSSVNFPKVLWVIFVDS